MALLVSLAQEFIAAACWHGSEIHIRGLKSRIAVTSLFIEMAGDIPFHSVLYGEQYRGSSKKTKNKKLPYDPAIPLMSIYPKEMKLGFQKDIAECLGFEARDRFY